MIRLAAFVARSTVNGPGERAVVWVQGCPRPICPGCWNPSFLDVNGKAASTTAAALAARILAIDGLDGVTFSGGEPFHQAGALAEVAGSVRAAGLHVLVFSGYELHELIGTRDADAFLACIDVLVAGPYRREVPCDEPLRSSANQVVHTLGVDLGAASAGVEVHVAADGTLALTGFPTDALRRRLTAR